SGFADNLYLLASASCRRTGHRPAPLTPLSWSSSSVMGETVEIAVAEPIVETTPTHFQGVPSGFPLRPTTDFVRFENHEIEQSIAERFEAQVRANADRIAVRTPRATLRYTDLNLQANRVAHALISACGTRSLPVALLLEKEAPHVAAILGTLK